ncbi:MAG: hypothetical protein ACM3PZ_03955 [Bacillota bacterium]
MEILAYTAIAIIGFFIGLFLSKLVMSDRRTNKALWLLLCIIALFGSIYVGFYLQVITLAFWACGIIPFMIGLLLPVIRKEEQSKSKS